MKRSVVPFAAFLLAVPLSGGAPLARAGDADKPAPAPTVDAALKLVAEGKFADALDAAKAVPDTATTYLKARYVVGEMELLLGDPAAAKEAFETVVAKKPSAAALAGAGRALMASGDAAGAVAPLAKAVAADPKAARYHAWLGIARVRSDAFGEGRKELDAAAKLDPADVDVVRAIVEDRLIADDGLGAEKAVAAFMKAKKDNPFGPFLQGIVLDKAGKYDEAIAAYQKAIALDPGFLDARRNLAIICVTQNPSYKDAKRTKIALEQLEAYVKLGGREESLKRLAEQLPGLVEKAGETPAK
jgi:tetratricopeptide (TPR) repeat protein